jgi:O-antigen ligase
MGKTMGITKRLNFDNIFAFLFLVAFPFGQIIRLSFNFAGLSIPLQPIDVIAGSGAVYALLKKFPKPLIIKSFMLFLAVAVFSFIFSIFIFKTFNLDYGFFYLMRLAAYFYFFVYLWNFAKKKANKKLLIDSLLGISVASAVFGWIQFFTFPDIKPFFVWGWDIHLFRLVGTFLDPAFLGLIIVFGLVISIYKCVKGWRFKDVLISVFLLISLAFTYSRASFLAFIAAVLVIIYFEKQFKKLVLFVVGIVVIAFLLPTAKNPAIGLFRSVTAIARIEDYQTTLKIFSTSPVFGIGYDNMCIAYQKYIGIQDFSSHACSGSDSSLLFVLATTGVIGFMIFLSLIEKVMRSLDRSVNAKIFIASSAALFVHSLFSNSLFYPWILGYIFVLLAVAIKE